jgi:septal ring-binding cell division protein DamX
VNILADKSLLAAYADNVYQVTPKHVKAAIQDSEFGRKTTNYKQYFIGSSLLIGLLTAAMGYVWWQYQHQPKTTVIEAKNIASKSPVVNNLAVVTHPEKAKIETKVTDNNAATIPNTTTLTSNARVAAPPTTVAPASRTVPLNGVQPAANAPAVNVPAQPVVMQATKVAAPVALPPVQMLPVNTAEIKTLVDKRLDVTKGLLLNGLPGTVTLQIKSLQTDAKLVGEQKIKDQLKAELDKISQQLEIDNIYLYQKKQNGQVYTVILYGEFADRSEALAALKNLPVPIKNNRPYLRTFAGINKDIEQTQ